MNNINNLTPVDFNPFQDARKIEKVTYTTEAQKEIWLACAIGEQEANLSYNESVSLILEGDFRRDAFESALRQLVRRHEALRATVSSSGEHLVIYEDIPYEAKFYDFSEMEDDEKQIAFKAFLTQQMHIPFNIEEGPLFRFFIHKFSPRHHYFTLFKHHIIGDGWSTGILLEDISKFYNGFVHGLNPILPVPYQISEYAKDELRYQQTSAYESAEQYWINLYSGNIPVLDLPTDYPRKSPRSFKGNRIDFELSRELVQRVRQVGAKAGCSLVNTLVAAFELFLHKTTNQRDITVGLPTAGQLATERFDLVGHCVNLLPLRSKIDTTASINEYLKSRRQSFFDAYDNQRFTFGELVKKLKIPRDESRIPLIPVMFNVDMGMDNAVSFEALKHTLISNPREFEAFELFLNVTNAKDRLILEWSYNSGLFTPKTIRSMMAAFEYLLTQVADDPDGTIEALRLTDGVVPKSIVTGEQLDYDKSSNFTKLIAQSAHENAERTAVIFENRRINYRQLESQTNQFAHYLSSIGVKKGMVVGVAMDRSIEMLVALVGIAKSGGVYLPLDPEYPEERIEFMLQDSTAKYLVTDKHHKGRWGSEVSIIIFGDIQANLDIQQTTPPSIPITGEDLVYLLYTSGSSGKPKGVQIKHSNLLNFLLSMQRQPGIQRADVVFNITTISFDIAGLELYLPLTVGATLVLSDQETTRDGRAILRSLSDRQVTLMQATPSTWRMMLDAGWEHRIPLKALCGGEPFPIELADKLLDRCQAVWNMYGPTETTIWSTIKEITRADNGLITVGNPIANTTVHILDEHHVPVAIGGIGELFIAGDGVAKGYLNRPELNKERFIADPADECSAMYATGDLGKIVSNGEIQCLGRKDNQVKIRGHRIELGEIEYQLSTLRGIKEAIVDAKPTPQGDTQLVAYVIADRDDKSDDSDSVSWKDRWDTIYDTGVEFNKSANLEEHQIDGSIYRQLENSEELKLQADEWLKESVDRIRKIGAERILEVGSGAGQILFGVAPFTSYYLATDYAHTAIDKLSEQLVAHPDKWGHVEAKTAPADDFSGIPAASLDLVLVNSVAQYFPDANYFLKVIENATKVVKPGGCIFIGDMQGKNSLEMCHAIDQFKRSSDTATLSRFQEVVKNRVRIEEELVADPGFFYLLPTLIPAITAVDVQLRKGLLLNETTNYHFDIWLYVNSTHQTIVSEIDHTWDDVKTEDRVRHLLTTHTGKTISITGIPNKRTAKDFLLSTILQQPETGQKTIGEIKPQVEAESTGFLPDTFWAIGEKYGYDTRVRWSTDGTDGCFEAIFLPPTVKNVVPATMAQLNTSTKKAIDFVRQPKADEATSVPAELIKSWKNELSKVLPDYMVPAHYVAVKQFPLTPNKKVDRKALPAIDWQQQRLGGNLPKTDTEKLVASIWEDCLGITNISLDDNFFELGGHSLIAVKLMATIEKEFGKRLPLVSLFKYPTIKQLSKLLEDSQVTTNWESLVPIKPTGNKPPLYVVHGIGLNVLFFQRAANYLNPEQPVFALQAKGLDGSLLSGQTIEEIAADYIDEIQKHSPKGPYALSGYSYGGMVAVEMAKQLKQMGKEVTFLGLFDSYTNKTVEQQFEGNRNEILKYKVKKILAIPFLFVKNPRLYARDKYLYARGEFYKFFKKVFPNRRLFNDPPAHIKLLQEQHSAALRTYNLTSYNGSVTLFKSKVKTLYIPYFETNGWEPYINGDIHIAEIPCNHAQLFREPAVKILAKELQKHLDLSFSRMKNDTEHEVNMLG
ncbi:non-ribosomal peptide synthetase [Parapedobacter sp. 10938]|uniref:non-ribosomal peptide synthetase n=1 Tax=Parapedobacter flavus TaxID=3110225 RepID=UPI002DBDF562|nr:non-ribosomal peptide synthetase [Parapedobacter sp. 10938]MEC3879883.1 amino acid adenylation domain-containing protein [Parapedobacter sp. 10938]